MIHTSNNCNMIPTHIVLLYLGLFRIIPLEGQYLPYSTPKVHRKPFDYGDILMFG